MIMPEDPVDETGEIPTVEFRLKTGVEQSTSCWVLR